MVNLLVKSALKTKWRASNVTDPRKTKREDHVKSAVDQASILWKDLTKLLNLSKRKLETSVTLLLRIFSANILLSKVLANKLKVTTALFVMDVVQRQSRGSDSRALFDTTTICVKSAKLKVWTVRIPCWRLESLNRLHTVLFASIKIN